MAVTEIIVLAILALKPEWRPDACDRTFALESAKTRCEERRDAGRAWAEELAGYIDREGNRYGGLGLREKVAVVGLMYRERSLEREDNCVLSLDAAHVVSRTPTTEEDVEYVTWLYGDGQRNRQRVRILEELDDGGLTVNRCPSGEQGIMQLTPREFRPGTIVPATGLPLPSGPGTTRERTRMAAENETNISLGVRALADCRERCCVDRADCRADWRDWLPAHNAGNCASDRFRHYRDQIVLYYRAALAYVCQQVPDAEVCADAAALNAEDGGR